MSSLKVTQAGIVSVITAIVGQLVAFVPSFAPDKQILISAASSVVAAAFLGANAVHKLADSNVSARTVEAGAIQAAREEIGRVDFNKLAADAVSAQASGQLSEIARGEAQKLIQGLLGQLATPAAPTVPPAPVSPAAASAAPPAAA